MEKELKFGQLVFFKGIDNQTALCRVIKRDYTTATCYRIKMICKKYFNPFFPSLCNINLTDFNKEDMTFLCRRNLLSTFD